MNKSRNYAKAMAAVLSVSLTAGMVLPAVGAGTVEKDENVYVNLNQDGSVSDIYVVNEYMLDEADKIVDYGSYTSVKNLTSEEELKVSGDEITAQAEKGKFLYQGELKDAQLPWKIGISYTLDGKTVTTEELAGKSGKLEINVSVQENKEARKDFFDNYLVQGTITLNTDQCSNIQAEGATQANVGKDRQLLYNIMAGQEMEFTITADVENFEMDAISFQAVPMSFDIDSDSLDTSKLTDQTDEIKDAADEFGEGAKKLDDGAQELLDGSSELHSGAQTLNSGMEALGSGANTLNGGLSSLDSGADSLKSGAEDLKEGAKAAADGSKTLKEGTDTLSSNLDVMVKSAGDLKKGIKTLTETSPELTKGSEKILEALKTIQKSLTSVEVGSEQIQTLLDSSSKILTAVQTVETGASALSGGLSTIQQSEPTIQELKKQNTNAAAYIRGLSATASALYATLPAELVNKYLGGLDVEGVIGNAENVAALLEQNNTALGSLTTGVDSAAAGAKTLTEGLTTLSEQYELFDKKLQSMPVVLETMITDQMKDLKDAIDLLVTEYGKLDQGITDYTKGAETIKEGYDALYSALKQVSKGVKELAGGAGALKEGNDSLLEGSGQLYTGTETLKNGTSELVAGGGELSTGIGSAKDGAAALAEGTGSLYSGVEELKEGTSELLDGTNEFSDKTKDIDTKVQDGIDDAINEISGGDFEAVSFVSEKNKNVDLVQFVMKTDPINVKEEEMPETEEVTETVVEKLKDLF